MIGKLNHVAIAVPDLEKATNTYRQTLGARVSPPTAQPEHGVTVVFVELPNAKIELLHPLGASSPIASSAIRTAACITSATRSTTSSPRANRLKAQGARVLGDGEPKIGAHGKPVLFLHPKDFVGTLVEIEQV
jgi:methylmalonyl-CoA/ethylmalonyl-CoA epimerase